MCGSNLETVAARGSSATTGLGRTKKLLGSKDLGSKCLELCFYCVGKSRTKHI